MSKSKTAALMGSLNCTILKNYILWWDNERSIMNTTLKSEINKCTDNNDRLLVKELKNVRVERDQLKPFFKSFVRSSQYHFKAVNLNEIYDRLNEKYFDGELPSSKNVRIKMSKRLTVVGGNASWKGHWKKGCPHTNDNIIVTQGTIKISVLYHQFYPEEFLTTFLHEMTHLYAPREGHGAKFTDKLASIFNKIGVNCSPRHLTYGLASYILHEPNSGKIHYSRQVKNYKAIVDNEGNELKLYNVSKLIER